MPEYYDNTQLSAYKSCPRKYYYRHVRHWRPAGTSLDLIFGLAWHEAMDVVWLRAKSEDSNEDILTRAYQAFLTTWLEEGGPDPEEMEPTPTGKLASKNPGVAAEMLHNYITLRRQFLQEIELLGVESPFMVPLWPSDTGDWPQYIGRLDKEFRHQGRTYIAEHKTTGSYSKDFVFRSDYIEQWSPNSQVDGYLHAGHMRWGQAMHEVWVDAALCHKTRHDGFKFIPVSRGLEQLDSWLSETRRWIQKVRVERLAHEENAEAAVSKSFLAYWPKNTEACGMYTGCPYRALCKFIANPEREQEPPDGYMVEEWKPFEVLGFAREEQKDEG